eukprot:15361755-Alexandrium_andersonii.AAC.1
MAEARSGRPSCRFQGSGIRGRTSPNLALSIVASHARGERKLSPTLVTSQEAARLVCSKGAVIKIDHLAERRGFMVAQPA